MNDKIKQLYDLYVSKGLINSVDFETFKNASESQINQLYSLGKDNGLFNTTDINTFSSAWSGTVQPTQPTEPVKKKEVTPMVSSSGATSLDSQEEPTRITDYLQQKAEPEMEPTPQVEIPYQPIEKPKVEQPTEIYTSVPYEEKPSKSFLTKAIDEQLSGLKGVEK